MARMFALLVYLKFIGRSAGKTLLGKRKNKNVTINKQETLLLLRSYQTHPCACGEIIEEIQQNASSLPLATQQLYKESTIKQLRDRLSSKLSKLLKEHQIEDADIRSELQKIKNLETKYIAKKPAMETPVPGPSCAMSDKRHSIALELSSSEEEKVPTIKKSKSAEKEGKKENKKKKLSL